MNAINTRNIGKGGNLNILITGSSGFIGSNLASALQNNHRVIGVDLEPGDSGVHTICADLRYPFEPELQNEFTMADIVIHCAANVGVSAFLQNPGLMVDNWCGDFGVFEQCHKHNTPLIYFSTSEIYGTNPNITEQSPMVIDVAKRSNYAIGKLFAERFVQSWLSNWIVLRPFNIVGPNQDALKGVIPGFIAKATQNIDIPVYAVNGVVPSRTFLHISDFCNVVDELVSRFNEFNATIWNVGSSKPYRIDAIANAIIKYLKSSSKVQITEPRNGDNVILQRNPGVCKIFNELGLPEPKGIEFILKDCMKFHIRKS